MCLERHYVNIDVRNTEVDAPIWNVIIFKFNLSKKKSTAIALIVLFIDCHSNPFYENSVEIFESWLHK